MTIGALIDRIYRDYLSNPADTPVQAPVTGIITDNQTTIVYDDEFAPEEKEAIGPGTVVELDLEQIRVVSHDEDTRTITTSAEGRGLYGTTAAAHTLGTLLKVAPRWPRQMVFDALADEVEALFPTLFAVGTEWASPLEANVELLATDNPIDVIDARQLVAGEYLEVPAQIVEVDDFSSGVGVQIQPRTAHQDIWIRYSKSFDRPTAETDTLLDLGVETSWQRILIFGVLNWVLLTADIDAVTVEFVTEALEAQGFPATTGTSLSVAVTRMQRAELDRASARQRARYEVPVSYRREL